MKKTRLYLSKTDYYHYPIPKSVEKEIEERRQIMENKVSNFKKKPLLIRLLSNKNIKRRIKPVEVSYSI